MGDGWAFKWFYSSESARRKALPAWIHEYNHHRPHTAIGRSTPLSRLTNLCGQYRCTASVTAATIPMDPVKMFRTETSRFCMKVG